jgi:hypothetical protein
VRGIWLGWREDEAKREAHKLLPNIDVMILDSLLLHARSLIKFYRSDGPSNDILLSDFAVPIEPLLNTRLKDTISTQSEFMYFISPIGET